MDLKANKAKTAYLILADGTVFTGKSFGCEGEVVGEIVFTDRNADIPSYRKLRCE